MKSLTLKATAIVLSVYGIVCVAAPVFAGEKCVPNYDHTEHYNQCHRNDVDGKPIRDENGFLIYDPEGVCEGISVPFSAKCVADEDDPTATCTLSDAIDLHVQIYDGVCDKSVYNDNPDIMYCNSGVWKDSTQTVSFRTCTQ